jgi:hypothetical protein
LVIKKSTVGKPAEEVSEKKVAKPAKVDVSEEKPAEEKKEDKPEVKVDLKDLDSQLDQILEKDQ